MSHRRKHGKVSNTRQGGQEIQHVAEKSKALVEKAHFLGSAAWQTMAGARKTAQVIREKPYHSVAVAFGLGLVLGCMLKRRSCDES